MSNSTPPNVFGTIANTLAHPVILTEEEKIFQEALEKAKQNKQHLGSIPALFTSLQSAKTASDVFRVLQNEREGNSIWKQQHGRKWVKRLNDLARAVVSCKPLVDQLVQLGSKVGAPLWGGISFIFGVIKDLSTTDEVLKQVQIRLEGSIKRFQKYYRPAQVTQLSLRSALLQYYERIIIFVVDLQAVFAHGLAVSLWKTVDRSVKEAVELFNREVKDLIENVDWAAIAGSQTEVHDGQAEIIRMIGNIQFQPTPTGGAVQPNGSTSISRCYGVPTMLSSKFTGRTQNLQNIRAALVRNPHALSQVAIFGPGGVGKTQILLKYAAVHSVDTQLAKAYSSIVYINASSAASINQSIVSFLSALRPNVSSKQPSGTLITDFYIRLRAQANWLLMFDDVENLDEIRDFLPPTNDAGHIIFATRNAGLASHLSLNSDPVEVEPMDDQTAVELAYSLAQASSRPDDKTTEVATRVARFAKGLPLAIEQVIHNAIHYSRSINETMALVETKEVRLLDQQNFSSLRGPNSSLCAIVMQSMADLGSRDREAEALFKILVYWSASSVPVRMITDAAGKLPVYLERKFTFDRGQITRNRNSDTDRVDVPSKPAKFRLFDEDPFHLDTWRKLCHIKEHSDKYNNVDLPLDDTRFDATLRAACSESSPIGRAFKNSDSALHAVQILTATGLARKSDVNTLWIHDLFSELAKAIIELEDKENSSALAAATLVYLAFPVPSNLALPERRLRYQQYLPHAIQSYQHLKTLRIENNLSLGPELSHIIASVFCTGVFDAGIALTPHGASPQTYFDSRRKKRDAQAILYYRSALAGYMASHKRIQAAGPVTSEQIIFSTVADECRERQHGYEDRNPHDKLQRYGRSAYWRVVQTLIRLSDLLEQGSYDDLEEAISLNFIALGMQEGLFGGDHNDTLQTRQNLVHQLIQAGRTEEAYKEAKTGLQNLLGWSEKKRVYCGGKEEHQSFSSSNIAASLCQDLALCCLELPGKERESVAYFKVFLRYCQNVLGEDIYWSTRPMRNLAMAYEKCGENLASIYWFGRSVQCALGMLELERLPYETGEEGREIWASGLVKSEAFLEEAVTCYEQARQRLGTFTEVSLCKFLGSVDSRIKLWRHDREMWGSPYPDVNTRTQSAFPSGETLAEAGLENEVEAEKVVERAVAEHEEGSVHRLDSEHVIPNPPYV